MKIAVTSTGPGLDDNVDPRFGRCPYFLIVNPETMSFEALENPSVTLGGGAGIQSAQLMADRDVEVVLTGNCGPNAFRTLQAAGIRVLTGVRGPAGEAVEQFKSGAFPAAAEPNVPGHFGMGAGAFPPQEGPAQAGGAPGIGAGMGRGGGMGMGRGMGAGVMAPSPGAVPPLPADMTAQPGAGLSPQDELEALRAQSQGMAEQLRAINARIEEVQRGRGPAALVAALDADKCTACGICQEACPAGAITVDHVAQIDQDGCTGCGQCVVECPESALSLRKR